jgi:Spy/CpxP family protein refolding chaperone
MTEISSITQSAYAALFNPYAAYNLQQYSDLGLSESQRTQIRSIVRSAQSDGLTQAQVQQQIESVLTPDQQSQLQSESGSSSTSATNTSSSSTTSSSLTTGSSQTASSNPFANLNLTSSEASQIEQLLQNAGSSGISLSQFTSDLSSILTTAQQSTFQSDVQSVLQQFNAAANSQAQTNSGPTNPFNDPDGPFANLNLTSSQQTQIQSILQNAQSQGLSPDQVNSEIEGVLTTSQQSTFASDLQNLQQQQQDQQTQSSQVSSPNPFSDPNGPFANLNLTSSQQSQIQQILQAAQSEGLSLDQVNDAIDGVLTSSQQSTFASDLQNLPGANAQSPSSTTSSSSTSSATNIFDNLSLTSSQQSQVESILQNAQSDGLSASDVFTQIQGVLTSSQQTTLAQNIQALQSASSGRRGQSNSGLTETETQNQIAAANAAVTQFLQDELNTLGVTTGGSF